MFLAFVLGVAGVAAQPAQAPPSVIPPRIIEEVPPRYPEGERGDHSVVVELLVLEDGSPAEVHLVDGVEPFASAAIEAVKASRFSPATRNGKIVRARIRIALAFTQPVVRPKPATEETAEPEAPATTSSTKSAAPTVIEEVHVAGQRDDPHTPTERRMTRAEMRVVPGSFGDPFRAIDIMPGLVPIISGLPYFYIRGAPPSAVGYYVDEVRVPYLFHFGLGPGVVHPALIDEVALHPATYPGRYGRYAGGIVAGATRDPAKELYGEANIRLYDAGAYVETPLLGGRATAGVGGRYSYTAGIISLFAPNLTLDYRDYNARFSYAINDQWRASAVLLGAYDYASETKSDGREEVIFASEFHRLDLRLDRRGEDGSIGRIGATVGVDRTRLEHARFAQDVVSGFRGRHGWHVSKKVDAEVGFDAMFDSYSGDIPSPYAVSRQDYRQAVALFWPRTETATGVWVSGTYRPWRGWEVTATMRSDVFTSEGEVAIGPSPRATVRVPLIRERLAFLAALGVAPQPPAFAIPVPAVGYHGLPGGLAFAYQKSAGTELKLPWKFTLTTIGFHHSYFNLRDFAQDREDVNFDEPQIDPKSPTQAYGLEVLLMRKLSERLAAFSSATISRAQVGSTPSSPARISPFDRTYVVQVGGVVDLGRHWTVSSRFLTYAGWPGEKPGDDRLPPFFRFDARIEKKWVWREHRYIALVFEGLNVTGSKDVVSRTCPGNGVPCRTNDIGPIIVPNIGVEGAL